MKILAAADGSKFTKKTLAFLMAHEQLLEGGELLVLNVQPPLPGEVARMLGANAVADYHRDEAERVLRPVERFLARHAVNARTHWVVGRAADEIVKSARKEKVHMIAMGTHGYGVLGSLVMGSVARQVVAASTLPVLLVE